MKASNPHVQILYILGHEHCGSTILEYHLSQQPGVFGAGEVSLLPRIVDSNCEPQLRRCSCGAEPIVQCPIWRAVDQSCREIGGKGLADIDPMSANSDVFRNDNELLFSAIARVAGARVIIDSSKGSTRLSRLIRETRLKVSVVHVTRPFAGYAYSHKKKYDVGLREILWKFVDYARHSKRTTARGAARLEFLRFEDLLADPEEVRRSLVGSMVPHDMNAMPRSGASSEGFHSLAGNNVRFYPEPLKASRTSVNFNAFSLHQRIALRTLDNIAQVFRPFTSL